jgi:osmotically inducible protein OsmC
MALSAELGKAGITPESIDTVATVTFDKLESGWTITESNLDVTAKIPGGDEKAFQEAANGAKANCPISRVLNTKITMNAKLV